MVRASLCALSNPYQGRDPHYRREILLRPSVVIHQTARSNLT
jgi:hypothetical protein